MKETTVSIRDIKLKAAVVHGTANAKTLLEKLKTGESHYDFIEVMTCPGGCIGGGGQPKEYLMSSETLHESRMKALYQKDAGMKIRSSYENPEIIQLYEKFYGKPLNELAEKMLHTNYIDRSTDLTKGMVKEMKKFKCKVCGYIHEAKSLPEDFTCPICKVPASQFEELVETEETGKSKYAGTKTEKNLMEAFAGESQARNKYKYFSMKAAQEGYEQIAEIFMQTSEQEVNMRKCGMRNFTGSVQQLRTF